MTGLFLLLGFMVVFMICIVIVFKYFAEQSQKFEDEMERYYNQQREQMKNYTGEWDKDDIEGNPV